jgi:hypothetical protein
MVGPFNKLFFFKPYRFIFLNFLLLLMGLLIFCY